MSTKKLAGQRVVTTMAGGGSVAVLLGALTLLAPSLAAAQAPVADAPGGNNGFIKVEGVEISAQPDNNPHQGCTFQIEFYNYDLGADLKATVAFTDQAPTSDGGVQIVSGSTSLSIGEDAAGGGNDLDARETYKLSFSGQPHKKQGYHVKLTIHADGSKGADVKHKVFWVEGCGTPPTTKPPTTTPPTTKPPTTKPPTTKPPTTKPPTMTVPPTTVPPTTKRPTTKPPATKPPTTKPPVERPTTRPTSQATEDETFEPVPTSFDAGLGGASSGSDGSSGGSPTGPAGIALLGFGGVLLAAGAYLGLRRRGRHTV
ncbi:hypothetical protein [Kribbella deserti]|uniref:LPXTG cell wall anchor domain-containing protein n=1 Tax=Kribbella deserti TaxID=1926257 RepID=A0ABV6QD48_9ACTN